MIDQNTPVDLNQPESSPQADYNSNISVEEENASGISPEFPMQPASIPPSTVVVSSGGGRMSKWFYLIFGTVFIAFLAVTGVLIITLTKKQGAVTEVLPIPTIATVSPTPTIVLSPTPTTIPVDPAVLKFREQSDSDEVTDIETDVKNTDLSSIEESLSALDSQMGFTSGK